MKKTTMTEGKLVKIITNDYPVERHLKVLTQMGLKDLSKTMTLAQAKASRDEIVAYCNDSLRANNHFWNWYSKGKQREFEELVYNMNKGPKVGKELSTGYLRSKEKTFNTSKLAHKNRS